MANMNVQQYAGSGQAAAIFGMYLPDHIEEYPNVQVLSADMSVAASLDRFIYQSPEKFTELGIAEQNLVGISAGMASEGYTCVAVAQAAFITMRAYEMDRQYLGYMQNKVILVGLNSGFYLQYFGNTHYCIEDLAIMRQIPGMTVLSPADAGEAVMAFEAALNCPGPVYIRLTGGSQAPTVYHETCPFTIGKNNIQNDELTFKLAGNKDLWFHAKQMPGSHVIVLTRGEDDLPDRLYEEAAAAAAYYSRGSSSEKVRS